VTSEVQVREPIMQMAAYPTQGRARVNTFAECGKGILALKRAIFFFNYETTLKFAGLDGPPIKCLSVHCRSVVHHGLSR